MKTREKLSSFINEYKEKQFFFSGSDFTKLLDPLPHFRRLDSLARLLEGVSTCAAVSFFRGRFYIATNEIQKQKKKKHAEKEKATIEKAMQYFSSIATYGEKDMLEREKVFRGLCNPEIFIVDIKAARRIYLGPNDIQKVVGDVYNEVVLDEINKKYGRSPAYSLVLRKCRGIHEDFKKLEASIIDAFNSFKIGRGEEEKLQEDMLSHISVDQLQAFRKGKEGYIFLEEDKNNHAEMQILFHFIAEREKAKERGEFIKEGDIYIGLSKLCCLSCHCMLRVINEEYLQGSGVILVRGWHDKDYSVRISSEIFKKLGLGKLLPTYNSHLEKGEKEAEKQKNYREAQGRSVSLLPSYSESEGSDGDGASASPEIDENHANLMNMKKILEKCDSGLTLRENIRVIDTGVALYNLKNPHYQSLFNFPEGAFPEKELSHIVQSFFNDLLALGKERLGLT